MSAQHTPGPWEWPDDGGVREFEIFGPDGTLICECSWHGCPLGEVGALVANAALIAAAPELLEALENLDSAIWRCVDAAEIEGTPVEDASNAARAAIAKATGAA